MDRREALDLRTAMRWSNDRLPPFAGQLPSPPMREWLEAVKHWNGGARGPVWFIADPLRTDINLIQHEAPIAYRWPLPYPVLVGGARPSEMDWYRLDRPDWYLDDGWAVTPESAGIADLDRRGLTKGSIEGRVQSAVLGGGVLVFGGRNFEPTTRPRITITLGGFWTQTVTVAAGSFMKVYSLPFIDTVPRPDYVPVSIASAPPARVAIEQFDASVSRPVMGFGDGWHELEFNERLGRLWRWLSNRGAIDFAVRWPRTSDPSTRRVMLHVEGESPLKYFSHPSRLTIRLGDRVLETRLLDDDFSFDAALPADVAAANWAGTITLETDQAFVPAERLWPRSRDRRQLGLRIFKCQLRVVSGPER